MNDILKEELIIEAQIASTLILQIFEIFNFF